MAYAANVSLQLCLFYNYNVNVRQKNKILFNKLDVKHFSWIKFLQLRIVQCFTIWILPKMAFIPSIQTDLEVLM